MAAVGAAGAASWFLPSGLVGFLVLLILLSIFLIAVCMDCGRHSFELQDPQIDKFSSTLIRVVKLEEVRENPMIDEIQKDEKEPVPEEVSSTSFTPWRSHPMAPPSQDLDSAHLFQTIGGRRDNGASSGPANDNPAQRQNGGGDDQHAGRSVAKITLSDHDRNSIYARVSKKVRLTNLPVHAPEEPEGDEPSPPLPYRGAELED
ncbi:uncharacterized protein LOC133418941 [Cololabis saira]|uniref:uncharacterized protein LOC133418941 n=1 Tax=Cololabis saira TaxID=129043 RepID=UPI002AD4ECFA|nr:uncharacterized protein LOC133418941 [Cololabis saira]